jgi:hypothetical protein
MFKGKRKSKPTNDIDSDIRRINEVEETATEDQPLEVTRHQTEVEEVPTSNEINADSKVPVKKSNSFFVSTMTFGNAQEAPVQNDAKNETDETDKFAAATQKHDEPKPAETERTERIIFDNPDEDLEDDQSEKLLEVKNPFIRRTTDSIEELHSRTISFDDSAVNLLSLSNDLINSAISSFTTICRNVCFIAFVTLMIGLLIGLYIGHCIKSKKMFILDTELKSYNFYQHEPKEVFF